MRHKNRLVLCRPDLVIGRNTVAARLHRRFPYMNVPIDRHTVAEKIHDQLLASLPVAVQSVQRGMVRDPRFAARMLTTILIPLMSLRARHAKIDPASVQDLTTKIFRACA